MSEFVVLLERLIGWAELWGMGTDSHSAEKLADTRAALVEYVARLEEEVERLREAARWIPVEERLPEKGDVVLAVSRIGKVEIRHTDYYTDINTLALYNSHWRALPEPPEVE